jgi:hypothetical protein
MVDLVPYCILVLAAIMVMDLSISDWSRLPYEITTMDRARSQYDTDRCVTSYRGGNGFPIVEYDHAYGVIAREIWNISHLSHAVVFILSEAGQRDTNRSRCCAMLLPGVRATRAPPGLAVITTIKNC